MKKRLSFIVLALLFVTTVNAQDIITLQNGDEIQAKVTKVGDREIEYKKWSNLIGPTYTKALSDIFMIKYENGEKEVYNQKNDQKNHVADVQVDSGREMMYRHGIDLYLGSRLLTEDDITRLFDNGWYDYYTSCQRQIRLGGNMVGFGISATVLGGVGYYISDVNNNKSSMVSSVIMGIFGEVSLAVGIVKSSVGKGRLSGLADRYNSGRTNTLSFSVQPSLMRTYDNSYAPGIGFALRF